MMAALLIMCPNASWEDELTMEGKQQRHTQSLTECLAQPQLKQPECHATHTHTHMLNTASITFAE